MADTADLLHEELLSLYRRTGEATGTYWPNYFLREVRRHGGLAVAKKLLLPGSETTGFDRLAKAQRADLSLEWIVTSDRFRHLFSPEELSLATQRLAELPAEAFPKRVPGPVSGAHELPEGSSYSEGAVLGVTVNRYERNPAARAACIKRHGSRCAACGLDFGERYGELGEGFIHVHHKRPLNTLKASYRVDPQRDLIPVCPNCHAMLHREEPPLDVEQLRTILASRSSQPPQLSSDSSPGP